ncbi:acyl-ACP--UDP-N-acetylglucosamine O-acyltransferase [bacterium]|nr:acyl-ACP--UDP-N-acetylglucosamine O-acyltransferase [bacterium]
MIHPTAVVHPKANIGEGVNIGPFSVIGENVTIGEGTEVMSSVIIDGWTTIGKNNRIYHGASIGLAPQDFSYKGQRAFVEIGDNNDIREYVTIHRAANEDGLTYVGSDNLLMAYVHVAHNCHVGNQVTIANYAGMAGHTVVEDQAVLGGLVGIHQHTRIGRLCMIGGCSKINKDIPPFSIVDGNPCRIFGMNFRGMRRRGIDQKSRLAVQTAITILGSRGLNIDEAVETILREVEQTPEVVHLVEFIKGSSRMGILNKGCGVGIRAGENN